MPHRTIAMASSWINQLGVIPKTVGIAGTLLGLAAALTTGPRKELREHLDVTHRTAQRMDSLVTIETRSLCIRVAELRHRDWTACVYP